MKKLSAPFLSLLLLTLFCFSCSDDDSESQVIIQQTQEAQFLDVPYGNNNQQVYDIYLPANRDLNTKVLILVHGGGWTAGDKVDMNPYRDIAKAELSEYAIVNINYRLASQGVSPFPMQLDDITAVINQLKAKRNEYVISEDYAFIGVSAGAHLSLLWTYDYDTQQDVAMVASLVGPTNFTDPAYSDFVNPSFLYFGVTPTTSALEQYSPYHQVQASSAPTILFYGGMDPLIPTSQGVDMEAKLTALGVENEFTLYPNEGHGWTGANALDTWTKLKSFILTHH
ncbi:MAG: alpha/beta hydrolase fold domain-containing protein [Bizionia paragorgiae]|uniref:alpha/beta hydrolase fold domain-containing protein n=1 Tax=Bizionia paragorgiae TaxID=283786 RepID=UPI003C392A7F